MAGQRRGPALLAAFGLALAAVVALGLASLSGPAPPASNQPAVEAESNLAELPLAFEQNRGQASRGIDFLARSSAGNFRVGPKGMTASLSGPEGRGAVLSLSLLGSSAARPQALERLPGRVNYLIGGDPSRWRTGISTFSRIRYRGVWPGVDLDWYGDGRRLEYDFRLAPGADPSAIGMRVRGAKDLRVAANGDLVISAGGGKIRQRAPVAYQLEGGRRDRVPASFAAAGSSVGFRVGPHDPSRPLIIDPVVMVYSTYLGGNAQDFGGGIAVDSTGAAYVSGDTGSTDFNTVGEIEGDSEQVDMFVSKLTPAGDALAYSTYLGGNANDSAGGIAVDSAGAAYVIGDTLSTDFCFTDCSLEENPPFIDVVVSKLTPAGDALAYSTYLGGGGDDFAGGIAVDSAGAAYVAGSTLSTDFCLPCSIEGDGGDSATDAFISKLTPEGTALAYSTYLGGSSADDARGIAVDSAGAAYVTGQTSSTNFDTEGEIEGDSAGLDVFVSKLDPAGTALAYSTYLGGGGNEFGDAVAVDAAGAAYVAGDTGSTDFDTVGQIEGDSGSTDAFVSKLAPAGNALAYSTYLGGDASDSAAGIAVDAAGAAYVAGQTASTDFDAVGQLEGDSAGTDAFVSKIGEAQPPGGLPPSARPTPSPTPSGRCAGRTATQTGTAGPDVITGTQGPDVIAALAGNDLIRGLGGNDVICGDAGRDRLNGGKGDDRLMGLAGRDRLAGGKGRDKVKGGGGKDMLSGGPQRDVCVGGPSKDRPTACERRRSI